MTEETDYCNKPIKEFLEEFKKEHPNADSSQLPILESMINENKSIICPSESLPVPAINAAQPKTFSNAR